MKTEGSLHYAVVESSAVGVPGGEQRRVESKLTQVESFRPATIEEAGAFAKGASGVVVKVSRRISDGQTVPQDLISYIGADGDGLLLHAAQLPGAEVETYEQPLQILPANLNAGAQWDMGTLRQQGMVFPTSGAVVGIEEVTTQEGSHKDCLHLVYTVSQAGGEMAGSGGNLKITGGVSRIDRWLARGIGLVKEESVTKLTLKNDQGAAVEISTTRVQQLASVSP